VPQGRAGRPEAASSVAPVSQGYERSLRPCLGTTIAPQRRATFRQALLASERGYTLVELLQVTIILGVVLTGLTVLFIQASNAELQSNRRFQAQQEARVAVDRMRREIHCSSGITPAGATNSIAVTIPSQCPTSGGSSITVTFRTVLVSTGRYKLERQVGTGPISKLADYISGANAFTYTAPTQTSLGKLRVTLPINIQPPGAGSNWDLAADMVLRNTSRLP
jgi:prepilin-type N-terminal cleavage/methylation domain-containing protein